MHPKDKFLTWLHQDVDFQWTCAKENCNSSDIGESNRCLGSRDREHNASSTCAIFQHCTTHNDPKAKKSQFKSIDQDMEQVSREVREAIHIRRNNPALNHNIDKLNIPKIFNQMLGTTHKTSTDISTNSNGLQDPSSIHSNRANRAFIYIIN